MRRTRPVFLARSRVIRELLQHAERYAAADANVLITGETGVGKDAMARFLHASGPRCHQPFVVVDCPGLPSTLVEAELFGHERGAFTDATMARAGRLEAAGMGTIYLDAVGGLTADAQGALLRAVEEKRVSRLGGTASIDIRARIVASAGADIEAAVREGAFRTDLYHRLRVLPLLIPPLRERREDILPLAGELILELAERLHRTPPTLGADAAQALLRYRWPGNVRELRYILERALVGGAGDEITSADLSQEVLEGHEAYLAPDGATRPTLVDVERRYIRITLRHAGGSQTEAARILGISRKALWEKRKRYGME